MARVTKLKVNSLDLDKIFAEGYVTRQGKVVSGDNWKYYRWTFGPVTQDVTLFQLPVNSIPLNGDRSPKIKMVVNGMKIDNSLLSIHPNAANTIIFDSSSTYQIDDQDLVEFWIPETTTN